MRASARFVPFPDSCHMAGVNLSRCLFPDRKLCRRKLHSIAALSLRQECGGEDALIRKLEFPGHGFHLVTPEGPADGLTG